MINKLSWLYFLASLILVGYIFLFSPKPAFAANLLSNQGFEDSISNWSKYGGTFQVTSTSVNSGSASASLTSTTQSTKWIYQIVLVTGGIGYTLSGYTLKNDSNISSVLLRISWYSSTDGSGSELSHTDSLTSLADNNSSFRFLSTGSTVAPDDANSVRVKAVVAFTSLTQSIAYFDDFTFEQTPLPTSTPTSTPTNTPTPTSTNTPVPTSSPTPTLKPTSSPTPTVKPSVIPTTDESSESGALLASVLGENTVDNLEKISSTPKEKEKAENKQNNSGTLLISLGGFLMLACGIIWVYKKKKGKRSENEETDNYL